MTDITAKEESTLRQFARAIIPMIEEYYKDPEHQAAFEAWKAEEDAKKGEDK